MKLLIVQLFPLSCHLGPNILLRTLFSNTLSLCSSLTVRDQVSHPYKTTGRIAVIYDSYESTMSGLLAPRVRSGVPATTPQSPVRPVAASFPVVYELYGWDGGV
jgi:hypothetical protein